GGVPRRRLRAAQLRRTQAPHVRGARRLAGDLDDAFRRVAAAAPRGSLRATTAAAASATHPGGDLLPVGLPGGAAAFRFAGLRALKAACATSSTGREHSRRGAVWMS